MPEENYDVNDSHLIESVKNAIDHVENNTTSTRDQKLNALLCIQNYAADVTTRQLEAWNAGQSL